MQHKHNLHPPLNTCGLSSQWRQRIRRVLGGNKTSVGWLRVSPYRWKCGVETVGRATGLSIEPDGVQLHERRRRCIVVAHQLAHDPRRLRRRRRQPPPRITTTTTTITSSSTTITSSSSSSTHRAANSGERPQPARPQMRGQLHGPHTTLRSRLCVASLLRCPIVLASKAP